MLLRELRDLGLVLDICQSGDAAVSYVQGLTLDMFLSDRKTQKAVTCEIQVIGQAAMKLSPEFRAGHPEVPWSKIAGMRDNLVHDYNKIDLLILWDSVQIGIPDMLSHLEHLRPCESDFPESNSSG